MNKPPQKATADTPAVVPLRISNDDDPRVLKETAKALVSAGATRLEVGVVDTPWEQTCLRLDMPDGEQLTIAILPAEERRVRAIARQNLRLKGAQ